MTYISGSTLMTPILSRPSRWRNDSRWFVVDALLNRWSILRPRLGEVKTTRCFVTNGNIPSKGLDGRRGERVGLTMEFQFAQGRFGDVGDLWLGGIEKESRAGG